MMKYLIAGVCGVALAGATYAGWSGIMKHQNVKADSGECEFCTPGAPMTPVALLDPSKIDVKNAKCVVAGDKVGTSTLTVEYQGKVYHICCEDCISKFSKDPEKYVKALDADPAKFGVK